MKVVKGKGIRVSHKKAVLLAIYVSRIITQIWESQLFRDNPTSQDNLISLPEVSRMRGIILVKWIIITKYLGTNKEYPSSSVQLSLDDFKTVSKLEKRGNEASGMDELKNLPLFKDSIIQRSHNF